MCQHWYKRFTDPGNRSRHMKAVHEATATVKKPPTMKPRETKAKITIPQQEKYEEPAHKVAAEDSVDFTKVDEEAENDSAMDDELENDTYKP